MTTVSTKAPPADAATVNDAATAPEAPKFVLTAAETRAIEAIAGYLKRRPTPEQLQLFVTPKLSVNQLANAILAKDPTAITIALRLASTYERALRNGKHGAEIAEILATARAAVTAASEGDTAVMPASAAPAA